MKKLITFSALLWALTTTLAAQEKPHLHVSTQWKECSFQLDSSLNQDAWHRFTAEAGLAAYFRPLSSAAALGKGKTEISVFQWQTKIDAGSEAWNNTFVHPDTAHWLTEGPRLAIPGLSARIGLSQNLDAGIFWTTNPEANYSIAGAMLQYHLPGFSKQKLDAAARLNFSTIYGPADIGFSNYGSDILISKQIGLYKDWLYVSPYLLGSVLVSHSRERSEKVNLSNQTVWGTQCAAGLVLNISFIQLAAEYNASRTNTLSYRLGAQFRLWK